VPDLGALLSFQVFVGVLTAGPLAVKLGSTGWRFVTGLAIVVARPVRWR
jgi:hypothetical protein